MVAFLLGGVAIGVGLLYSGERVRRWARRWLIALATLCWCLASPIALGWMATPLARPVPTTPRSDDPLRAIVLLTGQCESVLIGGGRVDVPTLMTRLRILQATQLYKANPALLVVVSGASDGGRPEAEVVRDDLIVGGVPADRIVLDPVARNTRESAINLARLLPSLGVRRFALVTSAMHMRRAVGAMTAVGLDPVAVAAPDPPILRAHSAVGLFWPNTATLSVAESMIYEYLGFIYYRVRGWV